MHDWLTALIYTESSLKIQNASSDSLSTTALGILTGILIFIVAGALAAYWAGKTQRDMEEKKPRVAFARRWNRKLIPPLWSANSNRTSARLVDGRIIPSMPSRS
jgi:hypothetical protein